jgi:guanosine-3',5'-bis(diphosphate) 3'-pyrophosphohydrolase
MTIKSKDLALILTALEFSSHKHRDQRRKDNSASPYINHPISLANVLCNEGKINNAKVICAALLHDTIEDTETTADELKSRFGKVITKIVLEVTDDKSLPKAERKLAQIEHAKHASKLAKLVKLADKICNLRDILFMPPEDWSIARKREYFDWSKAVIDEVRGTNKKLERVFDELYAAKPRLVNGNSLDKQAFKP